MLLNSCTNVKIILAKVELICKKVVVKSYALKEKKTRFKENH